MANLKDVGGRRTQTPTFSLWHTVKIEEITMRAKANETEEPGSKTKNKVGY